MAGSSLNEGAKEDSRFQSSDCKVQVSGCKSLDAEAMQNRKTLQSLQKECTELFKKSPATIA